MQRVLRWLFQNRDTGAITIAQAPNLLLWVVLVSGALDWGFHPVGRTGAMLAIVFKGSLLLWAIDELVRGVNPWRRILGAAVLVYGIMTLRR